MLYGVGRRLEECMFAQKKKCTREVYYTFLQIKIIWRRIVGFLRVAKRGPLFTHFGGARGCPRVVFT